MDTSKAYRLKNNAHIKEYNKLYYLRNKERIKKISKEKYASGGIKYVRNGYKRYEGNKRIGYRTCLGFWCRGEKQFKSEGPHNRICKRCEHYLTKGEADAG